MRFNPQIRNADLLSIRQRVIFVASNERQLFVVAIKKIIAQLHVHEKIFYLASVTQTGFLFRKI